MWWVVFYGVMAFPVATFTGRWLADEPDYKGHPGMLGLAAILGGLIWPVMIAGGLLAAVARVFGEWLAKW